MTINVTGGQTIKMSFKFKSAFFMYVAGGCYFMECSTSASYTLL